MTKPSPLVAKVPIPSTHFPGLALTQRDFRLNFCINCSSLSCLSTVPIYKPQILDKQLDEVRHFLIITPSVPLIIRLIFLPLVHIVGACGVCQGRYGEEVRHAAPLLLAVSDRFRL